MDSPAAGSDIADFFAKRSILLTGATGFVGKAILEKMLRSCPGIQSVFVLVREAKGQSVSQRLETIRGSSIFGRLHIDNPEAFKKVVAIKGDVTLPSLGLCAEDKQRLRTHVSIVIHCAASVKFTNPLKDTLESNLVGTANMLELAKKLDFLKTFVYVSTAYSNCDRADILEAVYPTSLTPQVAIAMLGSGELEQSEAAAAISKAMNGRPNFYTLSKSLAEQLVMSYEDSIPVCIIRPTMVAAALRDPIAGWVDSPNSCTGVLLAINHGLLRCLHVLSSSFAPDIVPVDLVVNLTISAAWHTGSAPQGSRKLVFHSCTGNANPMTVREMCNYARDAAWENPFKNTVAYPSVFLVSWVPLHALMDFALHRIPCEMIDLKAKLFREKPRMMRAYRKMSTMLKSLDFFGQHEFNFSTVNTSYLYEQLHAVDKELFGFDPASINWKFYIQSYVEGMRRFVLRESEEDLLVAKVRFRRLFKIHCALQQVKLFVLLCAIALITICVALRFIQC